MANLNPKDNSYSLKDFMYRDVQRDWPGYSDDERSQVDRTLARYLTLQSLYHFIRLDTILFLPQLGNFTVAGKKTTKVNDTAVTKTSTTTTKADVQNDKNVEKPFV